MNFLHFDHWVNQVRVGCFCKHVVRRSSTWSRGRLTSSPQVAELTNLADPDKIIYSMSFRHLCRQMIESCETETSSFYAADHPKYFSEMKDYKRSYLLET